MPAARTRERPPASWPATSPQLERVLAWTLALVFVVATGVVVAAADGLELPGVADGLTDSRILAAASLYALSQALRFARLALLLARPGLRLRRVLRVHLTTVGLGVLLPFKLSELVRVQQVSAIAGTWRTGLLIVWLERAMDAAVLGLLLVIALLGAPSMDADISPALVVVTAFAVTTVIIIAVLPENLREAMLFVVRRPYGERSVLVLRLLREALQLLHEAPRILRGRTSTLALLSVGIWVLEVTVVSVALDLDVGLARLSAGLLAVVSSVSLGVTAIMPVAGDRIRDALGPAEAVVAVGDYRLAVVGFSLLAATVAALAHAARVRA